MAIQCWAGAAGPCVLPLPRGCDIPEPLPGPRGQPWVSHPPQPGAPWVCWEADSSGQVTESVSELVSLFPRVDAHITTNLVS